jgi:magnesium transporter
VEIERTGRIVAYHPDEDRVELAAELRRIDPQRAARRLARIEPGEAGRLLELLNPAVVVQILWYLDEPRRAAILAAAPEGKGERWAAGRSYPEKTVGRLLESPRAVFRPDTSVGEAIERLRGLVQTALVTYGFVTDEEGRLRSVFAFRDLLFADRATPVGQIGIQRPFVLRPETPLVEAMQQVVTRHYPAYPVCDSEGRLLGMVRGQAIFEAEAFEISAQAGKMQGVREEERVTTSWKRSLFFRHPWLQLNLLTAFLAGGVVGAFQGTVDRILVLAAFVPVLLGQSSNTGCQALAVALRGMTLGEVRKGMIGRMIGKEAMLGLANGILIGLVSGGGMLWYATSQKDPRAWLLAGIVWVAMMVSCVASSVAGMLTPLALQKAGADPATASCIVVSTVTDTVSMFVFLGLATVLIR